MSGDRTGRPTRAAYGQAILELGRQSPDIYVIDCDVGKSCKTLPFSQALPDQYINVGISEQNACGMAAGLAVTGKIPYVTTYAVFGSLRMAEQIRQMCCYPNLNVRIACSHGGLTPASDGATHQGIEDLGVLRAIPGMTVVNPADYTSARQLVLGSAGCNGPVYLRFTRDAVPDIYSEAEAAGLAIGRANVLRRGGDASILCTGDVLSVGLDAAKLLEAEGIQARVIDMHTVKPIDRVAVIEAAFETRYLVTVEDHNVLCGLGGAVAEIVAELGEGQVRRIGIPDRFGESAPYPRLLSKHAITAEQVCRTVVHMRR